MRHIDEIYLDRELSILHLPYNDDVVNYYLYKSCKILRYQTISLFKIFILNY